MTSAPGLRTQRVRIYERREENVNGFPRSAYFFLKERWGRLDVRVKSQVVAQQPQTHTDYREDVKLTLDYSVDVPNNALLKVGDEVFFNRGSVKVKQLWRNEVRCERVDSATFQNFVLYEGESVQDGMHLVDDSSSS